METVIRTPKNGTIRGEKGNDGVDRFRGIRYATANRWKYPEMCGKWESIKDAVEFGPACPQARTFGDESKKQPESFYYREFRKGETYTYDEDS